MVFSNDLLSKILFPQDIVPPHEYFNYVSSMEHLQTLLAVKSLDLEEDCRQLATLTLASLPLMADDMIPLINKAFSSSPLNPRKHQRQGTTKARDMGTDPVDAEYSDIQRYIWLAEFLQWRLEDIGGSLSLVKSVQTLVADLLARCQSATDEGAESERAHRLYALQLTVGILQSLAYQHADDKADTHMQVFDIDLAISCAQFPFDVAVRSESLRLIGILASSMPQAVLGHVLKVVTLLENASSLGDFIDAHSINLASETLTAVGKAWIKEGRDAGELVMTVVGATIKAHAIQQLPLLRALEKALRESDVPSTSHVIFGLLSRTTLLPPTVDQEITDKEADKVLISLAKRLLQKVISVLKARSSSSCYRCCYSKMGWGGGKDAATLMAEAVYPES